MSFKKHIIYFLSYTMCLAACQSTNQIASLSSGPDSRFSEYIPAQNKIDVAKNANKMPYQATKDKLNELLHTKLEISFNWELRHLLGEAQLSLQPYFYSTSKLLLDAKGFEIHEVAIIKNEQKVPLIHFYDGMQLEIKLDTTYTRHEKYEIYINYTAKPDELVVHNPTIDFYDKGIYFINADGAMPHKPRQIWTQGETDAASCWFPTIDSPNQRCTQETIITVAENFVTLSNGDLVTSKSNENKTRTDVWKQTKPHAPYLFAIAVGEFAKVTDVWKGKSVEYYVEPKYEAHADAIFGNTPEMLSFFSDLLDYEYPWQKYSQVAVRDFLSAAMENTTASFFFENVQQTDRELLDSNHEDVIAHELFHHWFGNLVTCESWSNVALNEAFATYGEYLWIAHKYGQEAADHHLNQDLKHYLAEAVTKQEAIIRFYYDDTEHLFDRHSYQKGARVLHLLRSEIGDDAFFLGLQKYIKTYAFKDTEIHHLRLIFEDITGRDLNPFFNQWFLSSGHPVLSIDYQYDTLKNQIFVNVEQIQEENIIFDFPIDIDIYLNDSTIQRKQVNISKRKHTFPFFAEKRPKLVNFDAKKIFLGEKIDHKSVQEYVYQYHVAPLFLDRYEAIVTLSSHQKNNVVATQTLIAALDDSFWFIRQTALQKIKLQEEGISPNIIVKLQKMALTDENARVRNAALSRLQELDKTDFIDTFEKAVQDSSYIVSATALQSLYELSPAKALQIAQSLENCENKNIFNIVAGIYAEIGTSKHQEYFEIQLAKVDVLQRYSLIDYYKDFLNRSDDIVVETGLIALENIALHDNNWWIRLHATQAIDNIKKQYTSKRNNLQATLQKPVVISHEQIELLNTKINSMEALIEQIKDKETDQKVLKFYNNL
ncbi:MAG: M1 family aminopeptidase [Chitinophagales bacterium]